MTKAGLSEITAPGLIVGRNGLTNTRILLSESCGATECLAEISWTGLVRIHCLAKSGLQPTEASLAATLPKATYSGSLGPEATQVAPLLSPAPGLATPALRASLPLRRRPPDTSATEGLKWLAGLPFSKHLRRTTSKQILLSR